MRRAAVAVGRVIAACGAGDNQPTLPARPLSLAVNAVDGGTIQLAAYRGKPVVVGDAAAQTRAIFETISDALAKAGASLEDVVRTRVYLTDIADFEAVGRVHGEAFGDIRPANTTLQIAGLPNPDWLVEIEVDAVVPETSVPGPSVSETSA